MNIDVVKRFLDEEGKINQLPAKEKARFDVLEYLAESLKQDALFQTGL